MTTEMDHSNKQPGSSAPCRCWICAAASLKPFKPSNIKGKVTSDSFAITDSTYGVTSALERCGACGFIQSADMTRLDADFDRHHPLKKDRPSVQNLIAAKGVYAQYAALSAVGLCVAWFISLPYFYASVWLLVMGVL